ncbi:BspA family leucine-rich repeat surface protein [Listeria monocytogenes]|uniref:BspA family leucine-rich repeat surface protein n=1 Tax=Listeria monocytogenes TaxID=1639 RepID=UPI000BDF9A3D|nr:BspA family leucine-rich repeat surface protein [Listeria monocytogenes]PCX32942.1 BspA family leucine-rich repeat surface protein [Listeria monocytogenes]
MNKFSVRIILIISVLFIACGSANVSIAQERDTINKLPEVELGSLYTSNFITEEVAQDKPAEVENLEEAPTTDDLVQNPDVLEQPIADSDDSDLTVVNSGDFWTIYRNTVNGEYSLHMFGNVPSSKPTAWNSYLNRIKHIEIEEATLTGNFSSYFRNNVFTVLESVRIEGSNLSRVTSFALAFYGSGIEKVIIRDNNYPTAPSLLTTEGMFKNCSNLMEVDLSGLDTSAVTTMWDMFNSCRALEELDVSNFDTSSVTNMAAMFSDNEKLEKLDLSTFDTSSVTNMGTMFKNCTALKSLFLDNFTHAASSTDMFTGTTSLSYLFVSHNVSNFNGLENTNWYDEKNWVQFETLSQLQTYHRKQSEPIGYRKGAFLSLTMDAMGGQFEDAEGQKVQNKVFGDYWEEMLPVKDGHYFDGWYLNQDCTNKFDFSLPADASITIYAKWIENYTVIIPASISLNETSELKVEGINRGDKNLSVGLNRTATSISESNKLTLANTADTTVQCLAPLSWDGSETNPEKAILTLAPGSEITEGDAVMAIEAPENIQAGKYTGNVVFSIKYE